MSNVCLPHVWCYTLTRPRATHLPVSWIVLLDVYTHGTTPWMRDRPIAKSPPTHGNHRSPWSMPVPVDVRYACSLQFALESCSAVGNHYLNWHLAACDEVFIDSYRCRSFQNSSIIRNYNILYVTVRVANRLRQSNSFS